MSSIDFKFRALSFWTVFSFFKGIFGVKGILWDQKAFPEEEMISWLWRLAK
jgi:hypothetical protein